MKFNQLDPNVQNEIRMALALFQTGDFTLASKAKSTWKIECDALTEQDWAGLAAMAVQFIEPFGRVVGVPRGGIPFAKALEKYATPGIDSMLVVDDVWTTGGSMKRFWNQWVDEQGVAGTLDHSYYHGLVVFARNPVEPWVTALFQMPGTPVELQRPPVGEYVDHE